MPPKTLAHLRNPVTFLISGLSAGQTGAHRQHLTQQWFMVNMNWGELGLKSQLLQSTFCSMTHLHTCRNERGQTYNKEFLSLSLVSNRLTLQRIPLTVNNQILYDNRSPFKIFSLVPIWTIKTTQESPVSAQIPSPGFLFTLKMSLKKKKNPWPSLGFDHCLW